MSRDTVVGSWQMIDKQRRRHLLGEHKRNEKCGLMVTDEGWFEFRSKTEQEKMAEETCGQNQCCR